MFITTVSYAQNENDTIYQYQDEVEQLMENDNEESVQNYEDDIIELHERFSSPININVCTKELLQQFPFLSDIQIENILAYLYIHGEMKTIYELQLVKDMDWQTIRYMSAFFVARPIVRKQSFPSFKYLFKRGRNEIITRLDIPFYRSTGYTNKYLGTPYYHSLKYSYRYKDKVYAGLSAEKDRGEAFFASYNSKGYDSYSFHLLIKDVGIFKTLAIGDYRLSFGQGLVVSNNFLLGKTSYMTSLVRRGNSIRKHSSTDELNFFRGIAATMSLSKKFELSTFVSYRKMDGTIKEGMLTSIHSSGLHRTAKEIGDRNNFGLLLTGANANYLGDNGQIGLTGIYYHFSKPYMPVMRKYNIYNLRGQDFFNLSVDYSYRYKRCSIVGEEAMGSKGVAMLNKLQYSPFSGYNVMLLHRYYAHNYWAYFAHTISEGSSVQNENGWFLALDMVPARKLSCFAAVDLISFPWWRYRVSKSSKAIDMILRMTYAPRKTVQMDVYCRYKKKERDVSGSDGKDIRPTYQQSIRYRLFYFPRTVIKLSTILNYKLFGQRGFDKETGYQFTQSIAYLPQNRPLNVIIQGSYFNTDSYDTKMYISERSLLYTAYVPSFQGIGLHFSVRFQYKFGNRLLLIAHCGHTKYHDKDTIGSGPDMIDSNRRTDLKLQLRWKI
jgi:hypothetical protein